MLKAGDLFSFPESLAPFQAFFSSRDLPWTWIGNIRNALANFSFPDNHGRPAESIPPGVHIEGPVLIHPTVKLPPYAFIQGPAFIGAGTEIRPGAFLRGNVITGKNCCLGNSCEYKNALLLDGVESAHFNYVGDSILGNRSHLGAGVILANLKLTRDEVRAYTPEGRMSTGLRKFGAILGDAAEVGCNAVLQPGSILGPRSIVMSTVAFAGYLPPDTIARQVTEIRQFKRPDNKR